LHILTLSHEYPPIGGGGGKAAQDLCGGFAKMGHSVRMITAHYKDLTMKETLDGVEILRVRSLRLKPYKAGAITMAAFVLKGWIKARNEIKRQKPDLIHVHFAVPAGWIAYLLWKEFKIPYIITTQLGDIPGGVPHKTDRWFRWVFPFTPAVWKSAVRVIAVSAFTRNLVLAKYPVDVQIIHNGVHLESINPNNLIVQNPPMIVFAGRFTQQKDPIQIIRTLSKLKDIPWRCTMVGDGPLRSEIMQAIDKAEINDRFLFTGWVSPTEVREIFLNSDILFMPSLSEGLPLVGVQALAAGLALLVSDIGGFIDLIEAGCNGYKLPPGNHDDWEKMLRMMLTDPELTKEFKKHSFKLAERFDINRIVRQYVEIFMQVANQSE
jgi:glycosyltransferase involved in cell wall biosynthesis